MVIGKCRKSVLPVSNLDDKSSATLAVYLVWASELWSKSKKEGSIDKPSGNKGSYFVF